MFWSCLLWLYLSWVSSPWLSSSWLSDKDLMGLGLAAPKSQALNIHYHTVCREAPAKQCLPKKVGYSESQKALITQIFLSAKVVLTFYKQFGSIKTGKSVLDDKILSLQVFTRNIFKYNAIVTLNVNVACQ